MILALRALVEQLPDDEEIVVSGQDSWPRFWGTIADCKNWLDNVPEYESRLVQNTGSDNDFTFLH